VLKKANIDALDKMIAMMANPIGTPASRIVRTRRNVEAVV
jgi:hypothetical protein